MASMFDQDLPRNEANFAALSPLSFLERAADVYPQRTAVVHGALRRTWAQTYARCRQLASALQRAGLGKGDTVAVMLPNTPPMVEAHFGIPMAGAVLNTLNTRLDAHAIAFMLEILPAFSYLHSTGLIYCDFKPDNVIQSGDQMRLIDLGGVVHVDDQEAARGRAQQVAVTEVAILGDHHPVLGIGPPGTRIAGRWPKRSAPISKPDIASSAPCGLLKPSSSPALIANRCALKACGASRALRTAGCCLKAPSSRDCTRSHSQAWRCERRRVSKAPLARARCTWSCSLANSVVPPANATARALIGEPESDAAGIGRSRIGRHCFFVLGRRATKIIAGVELVAILERLHGADLVEISATGQRDAQRCALAEGERRHGARALVLHGPASRGARAREARGQRPDAGGRRPAPFPAAGASLRRGGTRGCPRARPDAARR